MTEHTDDTDLIDDLLEKDPVDTASDESYLDRDAPIGTPEPHAHQFDDLPDLPIMDAYPDDYEPVTASFSPPQMRLDVWHPRVAHTDVPTPDTKLLYIEETGDGLPNWDTDRAVSIVESFDGDAFVRSAFKSAMHDLENGSIIQSTHPDAIDRVLEELIAQHAMGGVPHGSLIAFREHLDLDFVTYTLGTMHPEIRFYIDHGQLKYYWPRINKNEFEHHNLYDKALSQIRQGLPELFGYVDTLLDVFDDSAYAVDFVMTTDGDWYLTDLALDALYYNQRDETWMALAEQDPDHPLNLETTFADDLEPPTE